MSILRIRDKNGVVHEIVALRGEKGADGNVSFDELTDAQKEELASLIGNFTVDQVLDINSENAIANKVVAEKFVVLGEQIVGVQSNLDSAINQLEVGFGNELSNGVYPAIEANTTGLANLQEYVDASVAGVEGYLPNIFERLTNLEQSLSGVETALDEIIAIQESLIGGESV